MPFPFLAAAMAAAPIIGGLVQGRVNKRAAIWTNAYNTPEAQMARYMKAGLNPNLIYSQGSSGNMTPLTPGNVGGGIAAAPAGYLAATQGETDISLKEQKIEESQTKQQVMMAQRDVLKANPYLSDRYMDALKTQVESAAKLKKQEADFMTEGWQTSSDPNDPNAVLVQRRGIAKMQAELDALIQRVGLNTADQKMKGEILKSTQMENEWKEVLNKFRKDGDIGPVQLWTMFAMLLSKFR